MMKIADDETIKKIIALWIFDNSISNNIKKKNNKITVSTAFELDRHRHQIALWNPNLGGDSRALRPHDVDEPS